MKKPPAGHPADGWGKHILLFGLVAFPVGDTAGAGDVAGDVPAGTAHVELRFISIKEVKDDEV